MNESIELQRKCFEIIVLKYIKNNESTQCYSLEAMQLIFSFDELYFRKEHLKKIMQDLKDVGYISFIKVRNTFDLIRITTKGQGYLDGLRMS